MGYFRGILSGLAALIFADLVKGLRSLFSFSQSATGMATDLLGVEHFLLGAVASPLFWILAILLFLSLSTWGVTVAKSTSW
jgi:hypothetical protein